MNYEPTTRASFDAYSHSFHDDMDSAYRPQGDTSGNLTRYSRAPQAEQHHAPAFNSTRVVGGAVSINLGIGGNATPINQESPNGPVRAVVSHAGTAGGSVAVTLQRIGGQQTVELIPGQPSSRTLVSTAIRAGLIEADGQGGFRDSGNVAKGPQKAPQAAAAPAPAVAPEEAPEAPKATLHEAFDAEEVSQWAKAIEPLPQQAYDMAVNRTMAAVVNGGTEGLDAALSRAAVELANQSGIDGAKAAEHIQNGAAMYQRTVERALEKVGLVGEEDTQAFYKWLRQAKQPEMSHALQQLVHKGNPGAFVGLGVQYKGWKAGRL